MFIHRIDPQKDYLMVSGDCFGGGFFLSIHGEVSLSALQEIVFLIGEELGPKIFGKDIENEQDRNTAFAYELGMM